MTTLRTVLLALASGALATEVTLAQASTEPRRLPQPKLGSVKPYDFPIPASRRLANGLSVLVVERHDVPLVSVRAVIGGDSLAANPPGKEGALSVMKAALVEGTTSMSGEGLADSTYALGITLTSRGFTGIRSVLRPAMMLLADVYRHPTFPREGVDRQISAAMPAARARGISIPQRSFRIATALTYGADHPYSRPITPESLGAVTRDDVVAMYDRFVAPANVTIVVVGDVSTDEAMAAVEAAFGSWTKPWSPPDTVVDPPRASATTIYLHDVPGAASVAVYMMQPAATRSVDTERARETSVDVLGYPASGSRLDARFRLSRGWSFTGVTASNVWRRAGQPGVIVSFTQDVNAAFVDSALAVWLGEIRALRTTRPVTTAEVEVARARERAQLPLRTETTDLLATRLSELAYTNLPLDFYRRSMRELDRLDSVTVARAVELDADRMAVVVVGDLSKIEATIRRANIAPVVVVDEKGRRIR